MRGLHEYTVASYVILSGGIVYGTLSVILETDHSIGSTLHASGFLILALAGIFGIFALVAKSKAFRYESASRLSILGYLSIIVMFLFDMLVVGTTFTMAEVFGLLIIISATFLSAYIVFFRAKRI
jgi:drug/metabolite transporter (DMT)-like permease